MAGDGGATRIRGMGRDWAGLGAHSCSGARVHGYLGLCHDEPGGVAADGENLDKNGVIAASVQVGKFPPTDVTGIIKDGSMVVLSISHEARPALLENGAPIWAVISLTLAGDTMEMAGMLERSQTIKRGTGKRQPD